MFLESDANLNLENEPEISVVVLYDQTDLGDRILCQPYYQFICSIEHSDDTVFYDVFWFANGNEVSNYTGVNAIATSDMPAVIDSKFLLDNGYNLGTTVGSIITISP